MTTRARIVIFAPTLAAARRAAAGVPGATVASPRSIRALSRAVEAMVRVAVVDPDHRDPHWEIAKRRILLPPAPQILREAISGITPKEAPPGPATARGPARAHWIPDTLTDRRAAALLEEPPVPLLWIVEDFRRLRISPAMFSRLERFGVRLAAFRALKTSMKGAARRRSRSRMGS
jgi:hypothetical protein